MLSDLYYETSESAVVEFAHFLSFKQLRNQLVNSLKRVMSAPKPSVAEVQNSLQKIARLSSGVLCAMTFTKIKNHDQFVHGL